MTSEVSIEITPDTNSGDGVGLRDQDVEQALRDAEALIGTPLRRKRGRKPKSETAQTQTVPPSFDAKQIEGTLVEVYLNILAILAHGPVQITQQQKDGIGPLLSHCANQYIPGDSSKHIPAVALVMVTFEIWRQSRQINAANAAQFEGVRQRDESEI